jgi:REP element-mobilizing transposase RayT
VTARGNETSSIYRDTGDRRHFCQLLGEGVATFGWKLHAYVLMENHFHLLVETPEPNLGRGMQWLNVSYSVWFNRRHRRSGHLFQGRYKAVILDPLGWGLALSRYVHLNPVRLRRQGLDKQARGRDRAGVGDKPERARVQARLGGIAALPMEFLSFLCGPGAGAGMADAREDSGTGRRAQGAGQPGGLSQVCRISRPPGPGR